MILVDSSIDIHGTVFANMEFFDLTKQNTMDEEGDQYNIFVHLFLNQLLKRIKFFKAGSNNRIVLAIDSKSWRKDYFESVKEKYFDGYYKTKEVTDEGYKAHREKSQNIDWKKIYAMMDEIIDVLNTCSDVLVLKVDTAEADDIVGALTLKFGDSEKITIISGDKDFKQLLKNPNVKLFDGRKGMYLEVDDANLFLKHHIIMGDKADEVPAIIERVGEKKALKLLPTIDMMLETDQKLKFRYEINKKLIDLTEIPSYITDEIFKQYEIKEKTFNFDANGLISFLKKYNCRELLKNVNAFRLYGYSSDVSFDSFENMNEQIVDNFLDNL